MSNKPWLWRKRSNEKTIFAMDKVVNPSRVIEEEVHKLPTDRESGLERSSRSLNEKLATVILDSPADPSKHAQMSQQGIRGKDEAEQEAESVEDLDEKESTETVTCTDETLQPLEKRLSGAIPQMLNEHEKVHVEIFENMKKTSKKIHDLTAENTHLTKALQAKEKSIGDLLRYQQQADAEFSTLMARLDSTEKENSFLRYEFHMLEKELEIRKEEMDYSRQYAEASHIQYLESAQKASNLEAECQRLHLLLQKRSPSSSGLLNKKNEIGMVRRETDMRRRKSNPNRDLICKNNDIGNSTEVSEKRISLMFKRLQDLDEENKALKRILTSKNTELESSRVMYAETASRLSKAEILLTKLSEHMKSMELVRCCYPTSNELPLTSKFDVPDMCFMDDFVEMEKQAIVSVDTPKRGYCSDVSGRELVPVEQDVSFSDRKHEFQFKHSTTERSFDWLQIVLNAILEEKCISKRSLDEIFDDIKIALGCINHPNACKSDTIHRSRHPGESNSVYDNSNQHCNSNLRNSIRRIIKLIEGIAPNPFTCRNRPDCLEENQHLSQSPTSKEYFIHVFQWKVSDLNPLLHQLVHTCKDLLTGRADFENFIEEVAFALDWSINNCANSTNASIARDKIKKHLSYHLSQNENEIENTIDDDNQYDLLEENRKLKDDLRNTASAKKELEAKLLSVTDESGNLKKQCQEAQNSIKGFQLEIETLKESKGIIEDQIEKQKLINEDLDTQLTIAQSKLNDIFQKFSSLEVELEDKKNSCEELETTCLELQLQLESIAKKGSPAYGSKEVEKIYKTGWEITTASSKLTECQETILNLGKQLKALASSSEVALLNKAISTTTTVANPTQKKNLIKRPSLLTQMQAEDNAKAQIHEPVQIKEGESTKVEEKPPLPQSENDSAQQASKIIDNVPDTSLTSKQNDRSNATQSLAIVSGKTQGGFGFLRKLFFRKRKEKGKGAHISAKA